MDCLFQPNRRKTDTPNNDAHGASAMDETLANINAVLAEHSHQIDTLVAANRALERSIQVLKKTPAGRFRPLTSHAATGLRRGTTRIMLTFWRNFSVTFKSLSKE